MTRRLFLAFCIFVFCLFLVYLGDQVSGATAEQAAIPVGRGQGYRPQHGEPGRAGAVQVCGVFSFLIFLIGFYFNVLQLITIMIHCLFFATFENVVNAILMKSQHYKLFLVEGTNWRSGRPPRRRFLRTRWRSMARTSTTSEWIAYAFICALLLYWTLE